MTRTFREGYIGMPPEDASGTQLKGLQSTQDAYGVKIDDTFNPIVKFYGATVPLDSLKIWYDPNLTETINGSTVKNAIDINNASQTATWSSTPSTGTTNGKTYWNINSTQQLLGAASNSYGITTGTSNAFTLFCTFYRNSNTASQWVLFDRDNTYNGSSLQDRGIFCHLWNNGNIYFDTNADTSVYNRAYFGSYSITTWYTLIVTQSGGTKNMYLDNQNKTLSTSNTQATNLVLGTAQARFGYVEGETPNTRFSVFGIYDKVLDANERQALHNAINVE